MKKLLIFICSFMAAGLLAGEVICHLHLSLFDDVLIVISAWAIPALIFMLRDDFRDFLLKSPGKSKKRAL